MSSHRRVFDATDNTLKLQANMPLTDSQKKMANRTLVVRDQRKQRAEFMERAETDWDAQLRRKKCLKLSEEERSKMRVESKLRKRKSKDNPKPEGHRTLKSFIDAVRKKP